MGDSGTPQIPLPTNVQGGVGYPMQYGVGAGQVYPMQGSSGGLVNKSAQIIGGAQAGANAVNQQQQMDRASTEFNEQQQEGADSGNYYDTMRSLDSANGGLRGAQPGQTPSGSGGGFFAALANSPIAHVVGAAVHALTGGIPHPPQGTPQAASVPVAGQGQPSPAAPGASGAPQVAQMAAKGGAITEPQFLIPQPQPVMIGMAKGGVVPTPPHIAKPHPSQGVYRIQRAESDLQSSKYGIAPPAPANQGLGSKTASPRATGFGVAQGSPRGMPGFAEGGVIPGFDAGGTIPAPAAAPVMQGSSGGLVNSSAQIIGGAQAGQNGANQQQQMDQSSTEFGENQQSGADAQAYYERLVSQHHATLHGLGLDDQSKRNDSQGVPVTQDMGGAPQAPGTQQSPSGPVTTSPLGSPPAGAPLTASTPQPAQGAPPQAGAPPSPATAGGTGQSPATNAPSPVQAAATAQAASAAATNPGAQAGQPETPDKPAHSITSDEYDQLDGLAMKAAASAARAGHDPNAVYQALTATKNAWIQGHILRNLSAANVALLNGDQEGVKRALQDANYYLPNGQDLKIQTDPKTGQLIYQDPIHPYLDASGAPYMSAKDPSGKPLQPNMIPVDAAHIQQLGTAFLDPMNLQNTVMAARSSVAKMQLEQAQSDATERQALARQDWGRSFLIRAQTDARLAPSQIYEHMGAADLDEAKRSYLGAAYFARTARAAQPTPEVGKEALDAASGIDSLVHGPVIGRQPASLPDGSPNPKAGQMMYDATKVPADLRGLDEDSALGIKSLAGDIVISNQGRMSSPAAQQLALQTYRAGQQSHLDPATRKPTSNVKIDRVNGVVNFWDPAKNNWGGGYRLSQYGAGRLATGGVHQLVDPNDPMAMEIAAGGSGAIPAPGNGSQEPSEGDADAALGTTPPTSEGDQSDQGGP